MACRAWITSCCILGVSALPGGLIPAGAHRGISVVLVPEPDGLDMYSIICLFWKFAIETPCQSLFGVVSIVRSFVCLGQRFVQTAIQLPSDLPYMKFLSTARIRRCSSGSGWYRSQTLVHDVVLRQKPPKPSDGSGMEAAWQTNTPTCGVGTPQIQRQHAYVGSALPVGDWGLIQGVQEMLLEVKPQANCERIDNLQADPRQESCPVVVLLYSGYILKLQARRSRARVSV